MLRFTPLPTVFVVAATLLAAVPVAAQPTGDAHGPDSSAARLAPTLSGTALTRPAIDHDLESSAPFRAIQESEEAIHGNVFLRATLGSFAGFSAGVLAGGAVLWLANAEDTRFLGLLVYAGTIAGATVGATTTGALSGRALVVAWLGSYVAVAAAAAAVAAGPVGFLVFFPVHGAFTARYASSSGS